MAGALGTAGMDAVWYISYRRGGGIEGPLAWEFSAGVEKWDDVSPPGQVGRRLLEGFLGREVPDRWARTTQNVVHWATGLLWGAQFGVVAGSAERPSWRYGLVLGPVAWLSAYVVLPLAKLYKPIWEYDASTLAKDLSAHLVFGTVTGAVFAAIAGRP
jgi:uncharacterized membrane protein YagU involved in acid resistance